jgi:hypothetical protein
MRRARRAWPASKRWSAAQLRCGIRVSMGMRVSVALVLILTVASVASAQQQLPSPRLQQRKQALVEDGIFRPGYSGLPDEAAGGYALSPDPAEVIEMILNGDGSSVRLQGYLTRMGDGTSDRGAPLTYFFARTTVSPTQLTFITKQVHGVWWSFAGTIERGSAQTNAQKGYYFLNGMLTEHFDTGQSAPRRVSLPLLPEGQSSQ